jgi:nucleoside-triphosphatase THEP1
MPQHVTAGKGNPRIAVVSGPRNSGKTAYLRFLASRAGEQGLRVDGWLSVAETGGRKERYFLEALASGQRRLVAAREPIFRHSLRAGAYHFDPDAFREAREIVQRAAAADLLVIDEFGPLETAGGGFSEILRSLLATYRGILVISVRSSLLPSLLAFIHAQRH